LLPGLDYAEGLIDPDEEHFLVAALRGLALEPFRFQGWTGKRVTAGYGWRYDFDDRSFTPAEPIPLFLLPLRERAATFAGMAPGEFVQALVTRYDPGAGIGWHRDRPVFEHVVGISFGAASVLRFRRRTSGTGFERRSLRLAERSVYHLAGDARHLWEHGIAPMDATRWSVTFRSLSERGKRR
jgi:alkylated DNA repair dioxygenase AlkB